MSVANPIMIAGFKALVERMKVLFPEEEGFQRMANPYKPEENPDLILRQGWGIAIGAATNTERFVNCKYSVGRSLTFVLSRQYDALENDVLAKQETELLLLKDQNKLINDLEQDVSVNGQTMYTRYETDGGMEYIRGDSDRFLMLRTEITLEYIENFT